MSTAAILRFVALSAVLACFTLILAGNAHARVNGNRNTDLAIGCGRLQDRYDSIMNQIAEQKGQMSQAQYDKLIAEARAIVRDWNDVCSDSFGHIAYLKSPKVLVGKLGNPTVVLQPTSPPPATKQVQSRSVLSKKK